jgi:protein associated with RNAse G/E
MTCVFSLQGVQALASIKIFSGDDDVKLFFDSTSGLPDFSRYQNRKNVDYEHKMYQMVIKYPKCQSNIQNGRKMFQYSPV